MKKSNSYPPINALVRGLEILAEISALGTASVGELHKRTGVSKPTIVRNLETLEFTGYIARDNVSGLYSLTSRVLSLSAGYEHDKRFVELVSPILNEFRQTMPWPSDLAFFDSDAMVIVETSRDTQAIMLNRAVGSRLSLTKSALGRAYLAFLSEEHLSSILDDLIMKKSIDTKERIELETKLKKYKKQGFAENNQSLSAQTRGVSVPIILNGKVEACVNTIVLAEIMSMQEVIERCVGPLQDMAKQIEAALMQDRTGGSKSMEMNK